VLIEALEAVSEHGHAIAPAPAGGAPTGETLDGAFPHLPDLDDEVPIVVEVPAAPVEPPPAVAAEVAELAEDVEAGVAAPVDADGPAERGEAIEWDDEDLPAIVAGDEHDALLAEPEPGSVLTGGKTRRSGAPRPLVILLPVLLVVAIAAGAAAFAGFFDGDDGAATVSKPPAPQVQAPVTTPLPIKVKVKTTTTAVATTATGTTTAATSTTTTTSSGPEATDAVGTTP
jgi:cell division septation protein DedD